MQSPRNGFRTLRRRQLRRLLTRVRVQKINHQGTKITKKHEGMQGKEVTNQTTKPTLPDISLPSLPSCVFVPFVPGG